MAIAARDVRLCAAATDRVERTTCEATLGAAGRPCSKLHFGAEQARCARDAQRWRSVLADTLPAKLDASPLSARGSLHIEGEGSAPIDVDLAPDLAHGVTIVAQRDGARIVLGSLSAGGPDFVAPSPAERASIGLELFAPGLVGAAKATGHPGDGGGAGTARIERAELLVPGHGTLSSPGAQSSLVATVSGGPPERGTSIDIAVHGDLGNALGRWHVTLLATTFVRDVVTSADLYPGTAIGGGAAGGVIGGGSRVPP
jgi:hypothetical protein